jgi:hypothetical protein
MPSWCRTCGNKGPAQCECESVPSPTSPVTPPEDRKGINVFHVSCTVDVCDLYGKEEEFSSPCCPVVAHRICKPKHCLLSVRDINPDCPRSSADQAETKPVRDEKEVATKDAGPTDNLKKQESVVQKDDEVQRGEKGAGDEDDDKTVEYTLPLIKNQMDKNDIKDPEPPKKETKKRRKRKPVKKATKKLKRTESKSLERGTAVDAFKLVQKHTLDIYCGDSDSPIKLYFFNGYRSALPLDVWHKVNEKARKSFEAGKKQAAVIYTYDGGWIYTDDITFFLYFDEKNKI